MAVKWTSDKIKELEELVLQGTSQSEIAVRLNTSVSAIKMAKSRFNIHANNVTPVTEVTDSNIIAELRYEIEKLTKRVFILESTNRKSEPEYDIYGEPKTTGIKFALRKNHT